MATDRTHRTPATPTTKPRDAVAMLKADHKKVSGLFAQFEKAHAASAKKQLVAEICHELTVHTTLEGNLLPRRQSRPQGP